MTESGLILEAIERSTKEVFETMLGATLPDARRVDGATPPDGGVVSLVGLTGSWSGTGTFCCTPSAARLVAARMLMMDEAEAHAENVDDDVLDAVAELTNMVVGNIKNILADRFGEMAISIPTVVYGKNFHFKNFTGTTQETCVFEWDAQQFFVKVCLAPTYDNCRNSRERGCLSAM